MRFFPRGAFTALTKPAAQAPVTQAQAQQVQQFQQLQQQQLQQQQLQQFQQQFWQQVGMPVMPVMPAMPVMPFAGFEAVAAAPGLPGPIQWQAQTSALAVRNDLKLDPLRLDPQWAQQLWYQGNIGDFGRPIF